jgi:hypothetical protein
MDIGNLFQIVFTLWYSTLQNKKVQKGKTTQEYSRIETLASFKFQGLLKKEK